MDFNVARKTIFAHPTFSVFALTAISYGVAFLYEQSRRSAFGVSMRVTGVKLGSFVIAALCIITAVMAFYILNKQLDTLIRRKIKDEKSAMYILNRVKTFFMAILFAGAYLSLPVMLEIRQETPLFSEYIAPYVNYVAAFLVLSLGLRLLNTGARYMFSRDKKGYLEYLKRYTKGIHKKEDQFLDNSCMWFITFFILFGLPVITGLTSPYVNDRYDIIRSQDRDTLSVVIDEEGSSLIVKEYDQRTRKFLDGYSVVAAEGKSFYSGELKAER